MSKAIFFDIDGTLWDFHKVIPESTKTAIQRLKKNGHLVFISSGRTRCFIHDENLLALGFNGLLCGCGTHIEYKGETIFDRELSTEEVNAALEVFDRHGMVTLMEGSKNFYTRFQELEKDQYGKYLLETEKDIILELEDYRNDWHAGKFTVVENGADMEAVKKDLEGNFDVIVHDVHVAEVLPTGYSKASGITHVCEMLGIDRKDTYAFGDSANDLEMLNIVNTGIVMGNGTKIAKAHADYITDDIHEDGIYNACVHFGLI